MRSVRTGSPGPRALLRLAILLAAASALPAADYEIGPGDVLRVEVQGWDEMNGPYPVDAEGFITFGDVGRVLVAGHTTAEVERKITTLLVQKQYYKRPRLNVTVAEYGSQKVFVAGEVPRPGPYALKGDRTLLTLLMELGPLGPNAGHEVVVIRPPGAGLPETATTSAATTATPSAPAPQGEQKAEGEDEVTDAAGAAPPEPPVTVPGLPFVPTGAEVSRISLLELQAGNRDKNIMLKAGDTVFVPKAAQVYVMGSVARPGAYRYSEGMTVLQALTAAGGVTARGSAGRTKLVRIVDGKKVEKKAKATDLVLPEDTLTVPERFF